ncbi:hypothetical protein HS088_TW07G00393 [Tripterygium wilfordii]|uniref:DUF7054 domain-containing protein n=1 Tax=Tripterygium wilfordii TaxID=458696 RepID=A0A7J7DEQ5_TRIWF|nr:uncharacterized protein At4g22758 [Tripterygium wilfordii]KAF5744813.1 hypothetical protein HS088_TW07G00393 [Tripterygium wilfordii]
MPTTKSTNRRGQESEKNRLKGKLVEKSSSFHGRIPGTTMSTSSQIRRPKTLPNLLSGKNVSGFLPDAKPLRLTKLLLNVTIQGSVGPVQVLISPESTVGDLVAAVLRQYSKEGRRPILPSTDPSAFGLHYSQFSLESLDREEKLMELGSRNFFICCQKKEETVDGGVTTTSSCSKEAEKATKSGFPWLKFMGF